ncbi:hypothetical protein [Microbacterium trichothecenolyticum]|uniref:Uncharacterized protein n=1 Tax=Microbacterium trichothecenolyticum TaxID=69370 RepID=A0A0M2H143_MICTR|nr:hypothetical protein [Microbacterium trichothecenolyticum]KJL39922.1 hypothetical protein RS82_04135 [Microbacterium trichothecenolyticum]
MSDADYDFPRDEVVWEAGFAKERQYAIEHGVDVYVFESIDALHRATGITTISAQSRAFPQPTANGVGAIILLAQPVTLSAIVHEVTHVGLFWARRTARRKQRAYGWLADHPEQIAELIGNLSAVIWHSLPEEIARE